MLQYVNAVDNLTMVVWAKCLIDWDVEMVCIFPFTTFSTDVFFSCG